MLAQVIAFVLPLGFDTLAVALALGLRGIQPLRPALVFTVFETLMPIVGIVVGRFAGERFAEPAGIAGGLILIGIGLYAIREAYGGDDETASLSFGSLRTAAAAGMAISMDEFAAGFPLGATGLPIGALLAAIGSQAFIVTFAGIAIGRSISKPAGGRAARFAGVGAAVAFCAVGMWLIVRSLMPA